MGEEPHADKNNSGVIRMSAVYLPSKRRARSIRPLRLF